MSDSVVSPRNAAISRDQRNRGGRKVAISFTPDHVYNVNREYTSMRTNIVIDDKLMRDTLHATGLKTKREAVEEGLRTLLRLRRQAGIRRLRGKLAWRGDL